MIIELYTGTNLCLNKAYIKNMDLPVSKRIVCIAVKTRPIVGHSQSTSFLS